MKKLRRLSALLVSGLMLFTSVDVTALAEEIAEGTQVVSEEASEDAFEEELMEMNSGEEIMEEISEECEVVSEEESEVVSEVSEEASKEVIEGPEVIEEEATEDVPEEVNGVGFSEDDIAHGESNSVTWIIDKTGKLTITGTGDWVRTETVFYEGTVLEYTELLPPWYEYYEDIVGVYVDLTECTNANCMFYKCENIYTFDLDCFDTSKVTDMSDMFAYDEKVTYIDLSSFNTSLVTDMSGMFYGCFYVHELDLNSFDTSQVTNMRDMFTLCGGYKFTELDISNFDTSNVTDMSSMFSYCEFLTELNVSNFDTSKVTDMSNMFSNCKELTELDISNFDTSKVTRMGNMFDNCKNLSELDVSNFDTASVTYVGDMFGNCSKLSKLDLSNFDATEISYMSGMFRKCTNLVKIETPKNVLTECQLTEYGTWYRSDTRASVTYMPTNLSKSITLTRDSVVKNTFTITYELNGGENNSANVTSYEEGKTITFKAPTRAGYTFKGWYDMEIEKKVTSVKNKNITVYATWAPITYKITYSLNGGKFAKGVVKPATYNTETSSLMLPYPEKQGYYFKGWYEDKAFTKLVMDNMIGIGSIGNKTVYAKWQGLEYYVSYDFDPSIDEDNIVDYCEYGTKKKVLSAVELGYYKPGYTLTGWSASIDGKSKNFKPGQNILNLTNEKDKMIVFTAQWKEIIYTISFDANGGKGSVKKIIVKGLNQCELPKNTFKKKGYTTDGWIDANGNIFEEGMKVSCLTNIDKNTVSLKANWTENNYILKYNSNVAKNAIIEKEHRYTEGFDTVGAYSLGFVNEGYNFVGWNTKANGKGQFYTPGSYVTGLAESGEFNLYAIWQPVNKNAVTIMYCSPMSEGYMKPSVMTKNFKPAKCTLKSKGQTFVGWTVQGEDTLYEYGDLLLWENYKDRVGGVVVLVAQFKDIKYTVKINANNGNKKEQPLVQKIDYSQPLLVENRTFNNENHVFLGYNTKANGTGTFYPANSKISRLSAKNNSTVTLYMVWEDMTRNINMAKLLQMMLEGKMTYFTADGNACATYPDTCEKSKISNIVGQKWFRENVLGLDSASKVDTSKLYTKFANKSADTKGSIAFANFASWYAISGGDTKVNVTSIKFTKPIIETCINATTWKRIKVAVKSGDYIICDGKVYVVYTVNEDTIDAFTIDKNGLVVMKSIWMYGSSIVVYRPSK